jgi:hypothetical protein
MSAIFIASFNLLLVSASVFFESLVTTATAAVQILMLVVNPTFTLAVEVSGIAVVLAGFSLHIFSARRSIVLQFFPPEEL